MTAQLADLLKISNQVLLIWFLVFLRVGAMAAMAPGLGESSIPSRVKLVLALALSVVVAPVIAADLLVAINAVPVPGLMLMEVVAGLLMGAVLRLFVAALQIAGTIAAQAMSLSQLFGGSAGEPQPAVGNLLVVGGIALAMGLGLHTRLIEFLIASYEAFPPGLRIVGTFALEWGVAGVARVFGLGFTIAGPFVIAGLIYNVALGAINRAMPQLMVAFVGAPALTAGGLVLLALSAPIALSVWHEAFTAFLVAPLEGMR